MSEFEWAGLIFLQEGRNPDGKEGWWCTSPDEKYAEWGRTKAEAEENLKRLLLKSASAPWNRRTYL